MGLRCAVPRLEAALADGAPSLPCPLIAVCPAAAAGCRIYAPGWYCEERDLVVLPLLLLEADDEPDSDDEPDDDYG